MTDEVTLAFFEVSLLIFLAEAVRSFLGKYGIPLLIGEIATGVMLSPYTLGGESFLTLIEIFLYLFIINQSCGETTET